MLALFIVLNIAIGISLSFSVFTLIKTRSLILKGFALLMTGGICILQMCALSHKDIMYKDILETLFFYFAMTTLLAGTVMMVLDVGLGLDKTVRQMKVEREIRETHDFVIKHTDNNNRQHR